MKYRVGALVTGLVFDEIEADSEDEALEIMCDRYGDKSISLCGSCSQKVSGLSVSEDIDMYEIYKMD